MCEIWKDIKGYEGHYQVSNMGRVKSLKRTILKSNGRYDTKPERILKIQYNERNNIYEVHLKLNRKRKCHKIHRLVADTFIPNPENKPEVNHIDGRRENNKVENLEWATTSENLHHAYNKLERTVVRSGSRKRKCKSISKEGNEQIYKSIAEASRLTGISETQIRRILNKECKNNLYDFMYL